MWSLDPSDPSRLWSPLHDVTPVDSSQRVRSRGRWYPLTILNDPQPSLIHHKLHWIGTEGCNYWQMLSSLADRPIFPLTTPRLGTGVGTAFLELPRSKRLLRQGADCELPVFFSNDGISMLDFSVLSQIMGDKVWWSWHLKNHGSVTKIVATLLQWFWRFPHVEIPGISSWPKHALRLFFWAKAKHRHKAKLILWDLCFEFRDTSWEKELLKALITWKKLPSKTGLSFLDPSTGDDEVLLTSRWRIWFVVMPCPDCNSSHENRSTRGHPVAFCVTLYGDAPSMLQVSAPSDKPPEAKAEAGNLDTLKFIFERIFWGFILMHNHIYSSYVILHTYNHVFWACLWLLQLHKPPYKLWPTLSWCHWQPRPGISSYAKSHCRWGSHVPARWKAMKPVRSAYRRLICIFLVVSFSFFFLHNKLIYTWYLIYSIHLTPHSMKIHRPKLFSPERPASKTQLKVGNSQCLAVPESR